jgi:hypothetical protein
VRISVPFLPTFWSVERPVQNIIKRPSRHYPRTILLTRFRSCCTALTRRSVSSNFRSIRASAARIFCSGVIALDGMRLLLRPYHTPSFVPLYFRASACIHPTHIFIVRLPLLASRIELSLRKNGRNKLRNPKVLPQKTRISRCAAWRIADDAELVGCLRHSHSSYAFAPWWA